jgi:hypothetical protein
MEQAFFCLGCFAIAAKIAIKSSRIGLFVLPPAHPF